MQVLIVKLEQKIRSSIAFLLDSELGLTVKEAATVQEALGVLLDEETPIDILICDDHADNQKLFKYILTADYKTQCVVLKDPKAAAVLAFPDLIMGYVNPAETSDEIKRIFEARLKEAKPEQRVGLDLEYFRIRALTAMQKLPLSFDLYLRLSSQKYVRMFKKGDIFTAKDVSDFLERKKVEHLYCEKKYASEFVKQVRDDLEAEVNNPNATPESSTKASISAQEAVAELGNRIGFTPEVQALAKQGMLLSLKSLGSGKPQLTKILKGVLAEKGRYTGSHAILTAQIACGLAATMEWSSDTTFQKLTFAAFFHDMVIRNNELAQVKTLEELERRKSEFTAEEHRIYKLHPVAVAQIITTFSDIPADVSVIIAQHHEKADGSGFPRAITGKNISPLSALFIVAHDLVDHLFESGTEGLPAFLADYKLRYSSGSFKKILEQTKLDSLGL